MVWPTCFDSKLKEYDMMELPGQQLLADSSFNRLDHLLNLNIKTQPGYIRKTGLCATISHTQTTDFIEKLIEAGMNIAMINLEYATRTDHVDVIKRIREAVKNFSIRKKTTYPLAIAARLTGKNLRTGLIAEEFGDTVTIKTGDKVTITSNEKYRDLCSNHIVFVGLMNVGNYMSKGQYILIDNEMICLKVLSTTATNVICTAERGGQLGSFKNIIIPSYIVELDNYSETDKMDIDLLVDLKVDIIIPSFVKNSTDVLNLRKMIDERGAKTAILTKIQTKESFHNFDDILKVSNGILISRRELASEIEPTKLILAEKNLINRANEAQVPVFICAQTFNTMKQKRVPLRTEMMDIFNMVQDGADVLVLSAETSVGPYAVDAIITMANVCKEAETCAWTMQIYHSRLRLMPIPQEHSTVVSISAVATSLRTLAAAIVVVTASGETAQKVSLLHPRCPVIAVTRYPKVARLLQMWRGIIPVIYDDAPDADWEQDVTRRTNFAMKFAMSERFLRVEDPVVLVHGWRRGSGFTDCMRISFATKDCM